MPSEPPRQLQKRAALLLDAMRAERQQQVSRYDALNVVAAAMLGFDGVLVTLVPSLAINHGWRTAGLVLLAVSIAMALMCLLDVPLSPCSWRPSAWPTLPGLRPFDLTHYLPEGPGEPQLQLAVITVQLYLNATVEVGETRNTLLLPKRRKLIAAMMLFAAAFVALGVGALT